MKEIYIVVHPQDVLRCYQRYRNGDSVMSEIEKIEPQIIITKDPPKLPKNLPEADIYKVCGAFYTGYAEGYSGDKQCVDDILEALTKAGHLAEVYMPATLISLLSRLRISS